MPEDQKQSTQYADSRPNEVHGIIVPLSFRMMAFMFFANSMRIIVFPMCIFHGCVRILPMTRIRVSTLLSVRLPVMAVFAAHLQSTRGEKPHNP